MNQLLSFHSFTTIFSLRREGVTLLLLGFSFALHSQSSESKQSNDSIQVLGGTFYEQQAGYNWGISPRNIPLMSYSESETNTKLSLRIRQRKDHLATFTPQLGDKETEGSYQMKSLFRKKNSFAWGSASYAYSKIAGIRFNESNDFDLVFPYVMGDTARAIPMDKHSYTFQAGAVQKLKSWLLSVSANYRACFSYRIQDPRPRNLSTFLEGHVGIGYEWSRYALGFTAGVGRYKQNNSVAFLSDVGVSKEYHFTGLGSDYYRFRGDNTEIFYKGRAYSLALGVTPSNKGRIGFFFHSDWSLLATDRIVRPLNNLPLSSLQLHQFGGKMGYQGETSTALRWGVLLYTQGSIRLGAIHIFGSSVGGIYPKVKTENNYYATDLSYGAKAFFRTSLTEKQKLQWGANVALGQTLFEEYFVPQAEQIRKGFILSLEPVIRYKGSKWEFFASPAYNLLLPVGKNSLVLAKQADPIAEYYELLTKTFSIDSSKKVSYLLTLGASFASNNRFAPYLHLTYCHTDVAVASQDLWQVSLGVSF